MGRFRAMAKASTKGPPATQAQLDLIEDLGGDARECMHLQEGSDAIRKLLRDRKPSGGRTNPGGGNRYGDPEVLGAWWGEP